MNFCIVPPHDKYVIVGIVMQWLKWCSNRRASVWIYWFRMDCNHCWYSAVDSGDFSSGFCSYNKVINSFALHEIKLSVILLFMK